MPVEVAERYQVPATIHTDHLVPIGSEDGVRFYRGQLKSEAESVRFTYLVPETPGPHPFVLCLPILAGGENLMWIIAGNLASRGYAVAWTKRVSSLMQEGDRSTELETIFRRTVIHNRMVLHWVKTQSEIEANRMALLGVSMGGIVGCAVMALEPNLRAGALVLAGGDIADLAMNSSERRVRQWRRWRDREDSLSDGELYRELDRDIVSDPARLGAYVDTEKIFLVGARFDHVVPMRNQVLLWESMGRPERLLVPLSHYTAAIAIFPILGRVAVFIDARMPAASSQQARMPPRGDEGPKKQVYRDMREPVLQSTKYPHSERRARRTCTSVVAPVSFSLTFEHLDNSHGRTPLPNCSPAPNWSQCPRHQGQATGSYVETCGEARREGSRQDLGQGNAGSRSLT